MSPINEDVAAAVTAAVRDALMEGLPVEVPGLGTFRVRHRPSRVDTRPDGTEEMLPPRDVVEFEAED